MIYSKTIAMKTDSLYCSLSILVLITCLLCSCNRSNDYSNKNEHENDRIEQPAKKGVQSTDNVSVIESVQNDSNKVRMDTLWYHGLTLNIYKTDSLNAEDILGIWTELDWADSTGARPILKRPCDAEIATITFRFVNDTLHMTDFGGQAAVDYVYPTQYSIIDFFIFCGQGRFLFQTQSRTIEAYFDYDIKDPVAGSWKYNGTAVFSWYSELDRKYIVKLFVRESSLDKYPVVNSSCP
jgi:hypothetical protein